MTICAPMEFGLCVASIDRCLPFYETLLGMRVAQRRSVDPEKSRQITYSSVGHRVVKLQAPFGERLKLLEGEPSDAIRTQEEGLLLSRPGGTFVSVIVDNLDELVERLAAQEYRIRTVPRIVQWEHDLRVSIVDDPEGNPIELCQFDDLSRYRPDLQASTTPR